jgi:hypothetical protein
MGGPSKERVWGETIRHAEQRARETRHVADVAACEAWNYRMEGYGGPAQPPRQIGDALNAGFRYLEIKCAGCTMHSTVDLTTLRRPRHRQHPLQMPLILRSSATSAGSRFGSTGILASGLVVAAGAVLFGA